MKSYIPMKKRSKKEQKAYYTSLRGSWNGVHPVTKIIPNKKHYNRKQAQNWKNDLPSALVFLRKETRKIQTYFPGLPYRQKNRNVIIPSAAPKQPFSGRYKIHA